MTELLVVPVEVPLTKDKSSFICVNCFKSYRGNMGVAPINDSVQFAKVMKTPDFQVFIPQTPHARNFLPIFDKFLSNTSKQLVFYYAGQPLKDLDEMDQVGQFHFIFDDGPVAQAEVVKHISENKNKDSTLYMITHRAPKNSVFSIGRGVVEGINLPQNCISFTAVRDSRLPMDQTMTNKNDEGAFTFELCRCLKEVRDCTPEMLENTLKKVIAQYGHIFTVGTSSPELLQLPIFTKEFD